MPVHNSFEPSVELYTYLVITMVNRTAKPISGVTRSALDQKITGFRSACKHRVCSLPSYAHRNFPTILARNSQLAKKKLSNRVGTFESISGLLIARHRFGEIVKKKSVVAGTKIGTSMKKAISFAENKVKKSERIAYFRGKLTHDSQTEKQEQVKIEKEYEVPVETIPVEEPILDEQEYETATPIVDTPANSPTQPAKSHISQGTASECLTCENLIRCDFRVNMSAESAGQIPKGISCSLAAEFSRKNGLVH